MPDDFETCKTGTRNLVLEQGEKIVRQDALLDEIETRLSNLAISCNSSAEDMRRYAAELLQHLTDTRPDTRINEG